MMLTRGVGVTSPIMYRAKGCICVYVDQFLGKMRGIEVVNQAWTSQSLRHELPGINLCTLCLASPNVSLISRVSGILAVWFGE